MDGTYRPDRYWTALNKDHWVYVKTVLEGNNIAKDLPEFEKIVRSRIGIQCLHVILFVCNIIDKMY